MSDSIDKCVFCSGDVVEKEVKEVLRGGVDTAVVVVEAGICQRCSQRYYDPPTVHKLDEIQLKLKRHETASFKPIGRSYEVA